ncbi:FUSC family protein [Paraburkholderia rhizosphaerae]|uniref:Fusaric acid resistance family protein n=1 Tax=Paraburkholderia rhizosphaerae TaxID=480658 RepID=A0A4R8L6N4_9BURK|nr:FUSC family protein [Paraburkholderia rhizosphaerae]TDY38291.1 fusaric acid resistance family protein [Paraburkholderia rhizosphaerae]
MNPLNSFAQLSRSAIFALGRELAAWKPSPERALFGAEAVLSVVLSVALAHMLQLTNTWWAAISGFAVMQTSFHSSAERATYRVLGTLLGALVGVVIGPLIGDRPWLFIPMLGVIGGICVYCGNGAVASYAWVLGGITSMLVTYEAHTLMSVEKTASFAVLRVAEVLVGVLSCVVVAGTFHLVIEWYRRRRPDAHVPPPPPATPTPPLRPLHAARMLLGLQTGLSIAIIASLTYTLRLPGFAQALVTTIAVMVLPTASLMSRDQRPVVQKMVQRLTGCLIAGALGVALLPLMNGHVIACLFALSCGVWVGCHVQSGSQGASYVGRQFTIAFIMVFVQDHHWSANPLPALMRLEGILIGIVTLAATMFATWNLPFLPSPDEASP